MKIWLNAGYAYLAKESAFIIVDVSNPANPSRKEIWHLPGLPPYAHIPSNEDLTGSGDYIYLIGSGLEGQEKLFVVDISDPLDPDPLGDVSTYKAKGIAVQGNYACIIGRDGFQIIDISDPDDPSVVGEVKSTRQSGSGWGTSFTGGYGFPYLPGPYQFYPGFRYGYPLGGFGTSGGYGFGYPFSGFGTSGGYGYRYPLGGFGTSGGYGYPYSRYNPYGYQKPNLPYPFDEFHIGGPSGLGYPGYGFGSSIGLGYSGYGFGAYPYGYGSAPYPYY
jgi:hypothetical protein